MKTVIFVLLIIASVFYLSVGENSALTNWLGQQSPGGQMEQITDALDHQVEQRLQSFQTQVEQKQQQQIESLQTSLVNVAQKLAKLEGKYSELAAQQSQVQSKPVAAPVAQVVSYPTASSDERPDVGVVPRPQSFGQSTQETMEVAAVDLLSEGDEVDEITQPQLMDVSQRRKRLQRLTERMTLRSLGVEK